MDSKVQVNQENNGDGEKEQKWEVKTQKVAGGVNVNYKMVKEQIQIHDTDNNRKRLWN